MPPPPHPASSTRPRDRHARALEERDDLGAAVVLEQRVVVFGAEAAVRVRLDGALVNRPHVVQLISPYTSALRGDSAQQLSSPEYAEGNSTSVWM